MTAAAGAPLVLSVFPSFAVGGAQMRFAALANRFPDRWRHRVIAMDGNRSAADRLAPEVDLAFPDLKMRKNATLANIRSFRDCLNAFRPSVMLTSNWGSIEWAMANIGAVTRHIHLEDGFGPDEISRQKRRRVFARRALLRRSTVVVPSRTLQRIATETWRLDPERVRYIPNGIDLSRFVTRLPPRAPADELILGTVAALRPEKNLGRLLRAFREVAQRTPARLVVAGDGPERKRLERLAAELGITTRVQFRGTVDDPAPLYAALDIFILSSDTEQMPLTVIEAMASGLPIVATDVGDVRGMVAAENAPLIVACDDHALSTALGDLMADPARRQRLGAVNRAKAKRVFDQESMFAAYAALLDLPRSGECRADWAAAGSGSSQARSR